MTVERSAAQGEAAEKRKLYMIGNSHIDPVWFWEWEEGMQEVKATFASALARMREFEEFQFTSTSTAFFEWIERLEPEMFAEIQSRVREGRWEITGGWFIEPDCILPCGEAFVRQGLYGQRYLKRKFGKLCRIGSNVDSFGHNPVLPQILKKSGMDAYVFMRPRLKQPAFSWESADGSQVTAVSLPGEYTTWFHGPTVKNIENTLERTAGWDKMVCCYGVGNHGGGPTIENIESIRALQGQRDDAELVFSNYAEFFEAIAGRELPVLSGPMEKVNEGCYSIDSPFKALNARAERRLLEADALMSMAASLRGAWMEETKEMESLWKILLFNHFHDTLGGTVIKRARDEAAMQVGGVCAGAGRIRALAIQQIAGTLDTRGEGFPLFVFCPGPAAYRGLVEAELEWFCQAPLTLLAPNGKEIPYQRIHTDAKVRHTTLGGRRRILFEAEAGPYGFAVYRTVARQPELCSNNAMEVQDPSAGCLENAYVKAVFDPATGRLVSLVDKATGYDALKAPASVCTYVDERDAWGGLQGRIYEQTREEFSLISMEKVESGPLREVIRVRQRLGDTKLEQLYFLGAKDRELTVENRLLFNHTWTLLKMGYPTGASCTCTEAQTAYGTVIRQLDGDSDEYFMQRFLDVRGRNGEGLAVANDGKYGFCLKDGVTQITLCRSAIYAQGNSPDWYNTVESYQYTDLGPQTFRLSLRPHGRALADGELYGMADRVCGAYLYLADSAHPGRLNLTRYSLTSADSPGVRVALVKKCEDDGCAVVRLLETEGRAQHFNLDFAGKQYAMEIGAHAIMTLKIDTQAETAKEVDLLEWERA